MLSFVRRFASHIIGTLSGFDRLRFRGSKRLLANVRGMMAFLWQEQVRLTAFKHYVQAATDTVRDAIVHQAQDQGRPLLYLDNARRSKEETALAIARRDGVRDGLIAVLSCVEPCVSFGVHKNRDSKQLELRLGTKKCLHYYHYYFDAQLGLMHTRLQSWFPFTVQICLNGREWLSRQMDRAGLGYVRRDNCFVQLADVAATQRLMDEQLASDWPVLLDGLARRSNPGLDEVLRAHPVPYYWSADESEWASDVMFRSPQALAKLAPRLYRHGIETLRSGDVLAFLGRKVAADKKIHGNFQAEVMTDLKERAEGKRIKHAVNRNWIKMYDKQGSVLRVETVINEPRPFKVYRPKEGDEEGTKDWRYLRKGVADLHRRAEVSHKANERYLESLATVEETTPLAELTASVCRPVRWHGVRVRALNLLGAEDARLLEAVSRGEFLVNGVRNRDLRPLLFEKLGSSAAERKRQAAAVTRKLRLLRAHGLVRKVPKSHRYQVTAQGRTLLTALAAARQADTKKLTQAA
jgi:hypothetical protein